MIIPFREKYTSKTARSLLQDKNRKSYYTENGQARSNHTLPVRLKCFKFCYFAKLPNNQFDFIYTPKAYADKAIRNILKT